MNISLPSEKMRKIQQDATNLLKAASVSIRQIAAFIGMTNAAKQAIPMAPVYHRQLQALINRVIPLAGSELQAMRQSYHNQVELPLEAREELVDLVVSSSQEPQCSPNHNPPSGFSDRDRCFPCGMGGKLPGPKDGRSLVSEGTGTAHQCFGADSSAPSNSDLHKGEEASTHSGKNRQYYSQVLHQSYRGNSLSKSQCNSLEHMELVPRASPSFVSRVPSRSGEPDS